MSFPAKVDDHRFRSYRAPRENGDTLVDPSFADWPAIVARNRLGLSSPSTTFFSTPLVTLRAQAQSDLIDAAVKHSIKILGKSRWNLASLDAARSQGLVVGGHQPDFFHCGVWYKNVVLSEAHQKHGMLPIHLQIDHDLCRAIGIKVPSLNEEGSVGVASIPIEQRTAVAPWETCFAKDLDSWRSFPERCLSAFRKVTQHTPLLSSIWSDVLELLELGLPLGEVISGARQRLEARHGIENLETPFSQVAQQFSFRFFVSKLLGDLANFRTIYNRCREEYRSYHRIRNAAHPVPALAQAQDWTEAPFWIYAKDATEGKSEFQTNVRRGLWIRNFSDHIELSNRHDFTHTVSLRQGVIDESCWAELDAKGICIRPRALTTTMFARLFLADLFVHGIGGGKYDQLTDLILQEWLGIKPPTYSVVTGTWRLPLEKVSHESFASVAMVSQESWFKKYHLERLSFEEVSPSVDRSSWESLAEQKRALLGNMPPRGEKKEWHQAITQVNQQMIVAASQYLHHMTEAIPFALQAQRRSAVLQSREYSFLLADQLPA